MEKEINSLKFFSFIGREMPALIEYVNERFNKEDRVRALMFIARSALDELNIEERKKFMEEIYPYLK